MTDALKVPALPVGMKEDTYYEASPWKGGFNHSWKRSTKPEFPDLVKYLKSLTFTKAFRPEFIVLHNTGAPTLQQWMATPGGQIQRQKNLEHFYRDQQHWSAGPHFFVSKDMILEGTPLNRMGVHSPSWNDVSIGIEMAGDYDREGFDPSVQANTTYLLAILHLFFGMKPSPFVLGRSGLHFHKEDVNTSHRNCPGKNVVKQPLVAATLGKMSQYKVPHMNALGESHLTFDLLAEGPMHMEAELHRMGMEADAARFPSLVQALKGRTLRVGSSGTAVLLAQKMLYAMGYHLNRSGYYGGASYTSVQDFQKKKGLRVDGELGAVTASAMDAVFVPAPPSPPPPPPPPPPPGPDTSPDGWHADLISWPSV